MFELTNTNFYTKENIAGTLKPESVEMSLSCTPITNKPTGEETRLIKEDPINEEEVKSNPNPQDISERDDNSDKSLELVKFN